MKPSLPLIPRLIPIFRLPPLAFEHPASAPAPTLTPGPAAAAGPSQSHRPHVSHDGSQGATEGWGAWWISSAPSASGKRPALSAERHWIHPVGHSVTHSNPTEDARTALPLTHDLNAKLRTTAIPSPLTSTDNVNLKSAGSASNTRSPKTDPMAKPNPDPDRDRDRDREAHEPPPPPTVAWFDHLRMV